MLVVSLGSVASVLIGWWGLLLLLGVIGLGILVPLALQARASGHDDRRHVTAAALVLVGGLILRAVIIFSSESIHVIGSGISMP